MLTCSPSNPLYLHYPIRIWSRTSVPIPRLRWGLPQAVVRDLEPALSPTVNLSREYILALQTNSYNEIRSTIFCS
ncbi:uncharacterized protein J3R85_019717 [Psidium guajava]|nr:uncharacterized protein J3R85_019717 [Psidium guajava]